MKIVDGFVETMQSKGLLNNDHADAEHFIKMLDVVRGGDDDDVRWMRFQSFRNLPSRTGIVMRMIRSISFSKQN